MVKADDYAAVAKQISTLSEKANNGDARAMVELRPLIRAYPAAFTAYSELSSAVRDMILSQITGANKGLLIADRVKAHLQKLAQELAGPAPTPLEALLVDRIVTCWLEVQYIDSLLISTYANAGSYKQGEYIQRRQERAHQRYLSTIKALAQIRRLALPAVQVNIGQNQVNTQAVMTGAKVKE